jgi:hypothetical protein
VRLPQFAIWAALNNHECSRNLKFERLSRNPYWTSQTDENPSD